MHSPPAQPVWTTPDLNKQFKLQAVLSMREVTFWKVKYGTCLGSLASTLAIENWHHGRWKNSYLFHSQTAWSILVITMLGTIKEHSVARTLGLCHVQNMFASSILSVRQVRLLRLLQNIVQPAIEPAATVMTTGTTKKASNKQELSKVPLTLLSIPIGIGLRNVLFLGASQPWYGGFLNRV